MTGTRSGIPTTHAGTNFRSRLEARWAAFFDLVSWSWVYEPLDASGYIPDFLIQGKHPFFVEVGPCITPEDFEAKSEKPGAVAGELGHDVLIVGVDPVSSYTETGCFDGVASPGLLGEICEGEDGSTVLSWGPARWCWTDRSRVLHQWDTEPVPSTASLEVWHDFMSYATRPGGGSRGDARPNPYASDLALLWREAGNRVQWRAA